MLKTIKVLIPVFLLLVVLVEKVKSADAENAGNKGSVAEADAPLDEDKEKPLKLDLQKVLNLVVSNNLDVKKALLDYKASTIKLRKFQSRFSYNLFLSPLYSSRENPSENPSTTFQGTQTDSLNVDTGISRKIITGTSVSLGYNGIYQNIKGAEIDAGPGGTIDFGGKGYQSGIVLSIRQDILKNMFGINDRLTEKILVNASRMQKDMVKLQLSNLLVQALIGYWSVMVAEENLKTAKSTLDSTIMIRDLVKRKQGLGLSEKEDLFDWDSKVLQSENVYETAEKNLYDARLAVKRTLDLDKETSFDIVTSFEKDPPSVDYERAIRDALSKRVDLRNQRIRMKSSELECRIAANNLDPSLSLNLSTGTVDYSGSSYPETFDDINRQWSVGFELRYPLGNREARIRMEQAMLEHEKNSVELKRLEKEIMDEIDSIVKQCDLAFSAYKKSVKSREFSEKYYNQVLIKFKQGRYDAVALKLSLDNYVKLQQQALKALVDYNISLLRRDLARNVIFENYNIKIDDILKNF